MCSLILLLSMTFKVWAATHARTQPLWARTSILQSSSKLNAFVSTSITLWPCVPRVMLLSVHHLGQKGKPT